MTYTRVEVVKITCDECNEEESLEINDDYEIPEDSEESWFKELKKDGWVYDKENDTHYCPDCIADIRADIDNYPEYVHLRK